jgi:enoyl-CoA hydratase/carnithine racemase
MGYQHLTLERRDQVATLTLNRPDAYNAFNLAFGHEIFQAVLEADDDPQVRCLLVTGAGKAF